MPLAASVLGGLYGLAIWIQALIGAIEVPGFFQARDPDPLSFIAVNAGCVIFCLSACVLIAHFLGRWRWDLDRTGKAIGILGFICGIAAYAYIGS